MGGGIGDGVGGRKIKLEKVVRYYHGLEEQFESGDILTLDGRKEVIWAINRGKITTIYASGKKMVRNTYRQGIDDDGKYLELVGGKKR